MDTEPKQIGSFLSSYSQKVVHANPSRPRKSGAPRSERDELVGKFAERVNAARAIDGFKPLPHGKFVRVLAKKATGELWAFYRECDRARSFSRLFWWGASNRDRARSR